MGSVSEQVKRLYDLGFGALADLLREATLVRTTSAGYNPESGTVTQTVEERRVRGFLRNFQTKQLDAHVLATDRVFVTRAKLLGDIVPNPETDYLVVGDERFSIIPPLREDPTRDIVALQLRRMD